MVKDSRLRLFLMIVVTLIFVTAPLWANGLFDAYLEVYSVDDRRSESLLLFREQQLLLERNCFSSELK